MIRAIIDTEKRETIRETYPYLGYYTNGDIEKVILFIAPKKGIIIFSSYEKKGEYWDNWDEGLFELFKGVIILSNEI